MDPIIRVTDISKSFDGHEVLRNISLDFYHGEIVAIIGPSGSGKSTLVRCLNGLEKVDQGDIIIDGMRVTNTQSVAGKVGMVFQQFNLFPHYTVIDNIIKPLRTVKKMPAPLASERAISLLEKVKLSSHASKYPASLSGGERQRVAIARALSMEPEIILFDEPTSSLDPELAYEVFDTIKNIAENNLTIILVTHQMNMVRNFAKRVIFLEGGHIFFDGTPEELLASENARIKQFLHKIYY